MQFQEYLTRELKLKYLTDFEVVCTYEGNSFWRLDFGLSEILATINANTCIQTIYSKRCTSFHEFGIEPESYLQIAFVNEIQEALLTELENIRLRLDNDDTEIEYYHEPPRDNPNYRVDSTSPLGCLNDPDYFRIHSYSIKMTTCEESKHDRFFILLRDQLSALKCPL